MAATVAMASARLSAAVCYLRLLTTLVTRAPTPGEAHTRALLFFAALVDTLSRHADRGRIAGLGGSAGLKPPHIGSAPGSANIQGGVKCLGSASAMMVRSVASDSAVLCMQTLRFLVGWADQATVSSSKNPSSNVTSSTVGAGESVGIGSDDRGNNAGMRPSVPARTHGESGPADAEGYGDAPVCLHGLRARLVGGNESGSVTAGENVAPCFVCPLLDKARRCSFIQPAVEQVRV